MGSTAEYHVASFIVQTFPENLVLLSEKLSALPGVEVHGANNGKLVVTAEGSSSGEIAALNLEIADMDEVLMVAPVYHQYDNLPSA